MRLSKDLDNDKEYDQSLAADMWAESNESDFDCASRQKPPGSYFDEFLKAIKVFGFLEHDVFNELTKSTQTLRIPKGESIKLQELGGFAVVISGAMKVYCKSTYSKQCDGVLEDPDASDPWAGYDLLNEISVSAPISSLSSILSLFSDTIKSDSEPSEFDKVNASVVALASEPSTIVVIPAKAFKDLTIKFPQAAANIVQVILFRWSQITVRTCQSYLNLTQEFYGTDRILNKSAAERIGDWLSEDLRLRIVNKMKMLGEESQKNIYEFRTPSTSEDSVEFKKDFLNSDFKSKERERAYSAASLNISGVKFGGSVNPSLVNFTESLASSSFKVVSDDNDETALRRAIVETIFTAIMLNTPISLSSSESNSDNELETETETETKTEINNKDSHPLKNKRDSSFMLSTDGEFNYTNDDNLFAFEGNENSPPLSYSDVLNEASQVIELYWYKKGEFISKCGEKCSGIIYVLDGTLEVGYRSKNLNKNAYNRLYEVQSGYITGFLETISSYSSFVDIVAKEDSCIAIISKSYFEKLAETFPLLYITAAKALTTSLTRPIVQLDFALEWISIKSGRLLVNEGDTANAIFFVLNGRMRLFNKDKVIGDYGQGCTIGELETMSGEKYSGSVIAVRDTEISRFPKTIVECLARQHPSVTFEMSRMVVEAMRLRGSLTNNNSDSSDFKTLAVLRTGATLPVEQFALRLSTAFKDLGKQVTVLTRSILIRYLGKYAFHKMGELKLKAYLANLEEKNDIILYVDDGQSISHWSRTCVDQADCVLLLADGSAPPVFSDIEKMVVKSPTKSRTHLILLHNYKVVSHGSTAKWLKHRPWISAHYHIQIPFVRDPHTPSVGSETQSRVQRKFNAIKNRVQDEIRHYRHAKQQDVSHEIAVEHLKYKNDFNRLARVLAGEAVGLVLGGGGARGISHIGVLQALEEAGVPIDLVGGTSIGSLIGGLYAKEYDIVPLMIKSKQFSVRLSSFWRLLLDLTYPMTAWTTGHAFNSAVWKCLGDSRIEDFWVRYFTNTTNLTDSKMEIHERGYAWRFIRASMSLAGLLPPLEENGMMLLDGGYVDNLPVTEMKRMGARYIIAVDVGAVDDTTPMTYGDTLSGFGAIINKYNPFSATPNVPNIAEIQQRLTYVSSVKALEEAKVADGVIYLRPPIDNYATLDFSRFDEIREVGFLYGAKEIKNRIAHGELPSFKSPVVAKEKSTTFKKYRRYSF